MCCDELTTCELSLGIAYRLIFTDVQHFHSHTWVDQNPMPLFTLQIVTTTVASWVLYLLDSILIEFLSIPTTYLFIWQFYA